ncbi:hypothetical protein [uncultured Pedobacter sp.]|uniref:hypothetical protein n=1 Tax=uncultured Pedobacter sp. TaxID=246139 RepID=UPI0025EE0F7A|nr:hypothetical protein [uncultured Pedobacter sp.]
MTILSDKLPTSTLLELKAGDEIKTADGQTDTIKSIHISETDEFLMFLFQLEGNHVVVKKLRQVC